MRIHLSDRAIAVISFILVVLFFILMQSYEAEVTGHMARHFMGY